MSSQNPSDEVVVLAVQRLAKQGEGVADWGGRSVFIDGALPGELVEARVFSDGKVQRGELLRVVRPSPHRRTPVCPLANTCGGCDWMHLDEAAQLAAKEEIVVSTLAHLGGIGSESYQRLPTLTAGPSIGYRRRAVMHFAGERLGFFGRKSHDRIPVPHCPALVPALASLPGPLSEGLRSIVKDVETVTLLDGGKRGFAFAVQLKGDVKPRHEAAVEAAMKKTKAIGAVLLPAKGTPKKLGKPDLRVDGDVPLFLRPDAFAQANEEANVALVSAAVSALSLTPQDSVLELYSGNGNFSFALARLAKDVTGVEVSQISADLARKSVLAGKVANLRFVQGDALKIAKAFADEGRQFDALLVDPPRTGAPGIGRVAKRLQIKRLVYVACDPASLARDAADLKAAQLVPKTLQLVDMFPQTHHVEAVMSFEC